MAGYGKDLKYAYFNAPEEGRFKVLKLIDCTEKGGGYFLVKWTTTSAAIPLKNYKANELDVAIKAFNDRVDLERNAEPQFTLIAEY
jgi:hypothetical protein